MKTETHVVSESMFLFEEPEPKKIKTVFYLTLCAYTNFKNFNNFRQLLGDENIDILNATNGLAGAGLSININNWNIGLNYAFVFGNNNSNKDRLTVIKARATQYGFNFGYIFFNNKRVNLIPRVDIKLDHYRLINTINEQTTIGDYLENKDLDLRFNQGVGQIGAEIAFNFDADVYYFRIGLYGGYLSKLNLFPTVNSAHNNLSNINEINYKNYCFGVHLTFY